MSREQNVLETNFQRDELSVIPSFFVKRYCIVNVIAKFNPQLKKYLESDLKQKFLSPQIQNEILKDLAHALLRSLIARIRTESVGLSKEPVFSIIIDETTDINRIEQVAICVRFCNKDMESEGVYWISSDIQD